MDCENNVLKFKGKKVKNENVEHILKFYTDMDECKRDPDKLSQLKATIAGSKRRSSKKEVKVDVFPQSNN